MIAILALFVLAATANFTVQPEPALVLNGNPAVAAQAGTITISFNNVAGADPIEFNTALGINGVDINGTPVASDTQVAGAAIEATLSGDTCGDGTDVLMFRLTGVNPGQTTNMRTDAGCLVSDMNVYCQVPANGLPAGQSATLSANWVTTPSNSICICPDGKDMVEALLTLTGAVQGSNRGIANSCNGECVADQSELQFNITLPCQPSGSLIVVKDDCVPSVCVGGLYMTNFEVTNNGTSAVGGTFEDTFPSQYEIVSFPSECTKSTVGDRDRLVCEYSSVEPGVTISFTVSYKVRDTAVVGTFISNCATVSTNGASGVYEDCDTNEVGTCPLINYKDDCVTAVCPGRFYTFTYEVINTGTAHSGEVVLQDTFPTGYTWSNVPSPCTVNGNTFTCVWKDVAPGAQYDLFVPYRVNDNAVVGSRITNCATAYLSQTPSSSIEDCDTNLVESCPCIEYAGICDPNDSQCCPPLQCLRHAPNPDCNGTVVTVYRCVTRGGFV